MPATRSPLATLVLLLAASRGPAQTEWQEVREPTVPGWSYCATAWDQARSQLVSFGGKRWTGSWVYSDETWVLEGLGAALGAGSCHWRRVSTASAPAAGDQWAMAHDAERRNCVLFGGSETWIWEGETWRRVAPATSPPHRWGHAMVYVATTRKVLLFGGRSGPTFYNDTWEWDGATWTRLQPTRSPPVRRAHAMSALAGGRVLLFGGIYDPTPAAIAMSDTWQWDGSNWTQMNLVNVPPRRIHHRMAGVYMFGGSGPAFLRDFWEWSGYDWVSLSADASARAGHAMVETPHGIAVVNGEDALATLSELHFFQPWPSRSWSRLLVDQRPGGAYGLSGCQMVYDRLNRQVVLFGGRYVQGTATYPTWRTWLHDGIGWFRRERYKESAPLSRFGHAMWWDSLRKATFVFGGTTNMYGTPMNDTWALVLGLDWQQVRPPVSPPGRCYPAAAFDEERGVAVLFGGFLTPNWLNDTWTYDGTTWRQAITLERPPVLTYPVVAYDAGRKVVVLFGRTSANVAMTWEWNGVTWRDRTPSRSPQPRDGHAMAYDRNRGRLVLFGGSPFLNSLNDTWEWDGSAWTERFPTLPPSQRLEHAMAYDEARGHVLVFGGIVGASMANDTFRYLAPRCDVIGLANVNRPPVVSCLTEPLLGGRLDVTFPNPLQAGFLMVGFAPRLQPPIPLGGGVLCGSFSLHTLPSFLVHSNQNPGRVSLAIPPHADLAGLGLLFQGAFLETPRCFALTEGISSTLRAR